jgi:L-threonylcarbamoyladenylate synthase
MRRIDARAETFERVVEEVAAVVLDGGVVIFPTDTVYGIGCDPFRAEAVERIYELKDRSREKPLTLHLSGVPEFLEYARDNARARALARAFLPGPLTIVVRRPAIIDARVAAGLPTIGLRVPDHSLCAFILERCGPLAATSANASGAPAFTGREPASELPPADLFVDAGPAPGGVESTVVDVSQHEPRLIREGAIRFAEVLATLA